MAFATHGARMKMNAKRWMLLSITLMSLLAAGCSSHTVVAGNLFSMLVAIGLFYSTINLRKAG